MRSYFPKNPCPINPSTNHWKNHMHIHIHIHILDTAQSKKQTKKNKMDQHNKTSTRHHSPPLYSHQSTQKETSLSNLQNLSNSTLPLVIVLFFNMYFPCTSNSHLSYKKNSKLSSLVRR